MSLLDRLIASKKNLSFNYQRQLSTKQHTTHTHAVFPIKNK